jgi:hypothetical protein
VRAWNKTTAFYYAAQQAPVNEPIILAERGGARLRAGEQRSGDECSFAPVCAPRRASGGGQRSGRSAGGGRGAHATGPSSPGTYEEVVWPGGGFMEDARGYTLARALPQQRHAEWEQAPVRVGGTGGVYMCGDYRETASIQGALASGRRAAEAVIKDWQGINLAGAMMVAGLLTRGWGLR